MNRPYVICHMVMSLDGKVTGEFLKDSNSQKAIEIYYQLNRKYKADAFACGRVTMEESFTNNFQVDLTAFKGKKVEKEDFIAKNNYNYYAISFDRCGKVGWTNDHLIDEDEGYNDAHIVEVITENTPDEYLLYLQSINVSYIFAGKENISIQTALNKLKEKFNINFLLLEGGSIINQAFLDENVIDELSLVIAPVGADKNDKSLFYTSDIKGFNLISKEIIEDITYLKYKKEG